MTTLTRNKPFASRGPKIAIDAGLAPGAHRFQLEVLDDSGLRSRPDAVTVVVRSRVIRPPVVGPPVRPAAAHPAGVRHPAVAGPRRRRP